MEMEERNNKIEEHNAKVLATLVNTDFPRNKDGSINGNFKNLTGQTFGRQTVTEYAGQTKMVNGRHYYWIQCLCKSPAKLVLAGSLTSEATTSCGCYQKEKVSETMTTHGLSDDPWYKTAENQQRRMTDPNHLNYPRYGGKGMVFGEGMETIEERIKFYRENFGEPKEGYEVDRWPDRDRGYAKDNVRYVTKQENQQNKDLCHLHTINGVKTRTITAWKSNKASGRLCDEWAESSHRYLADVVEIPDGMYLARHDMTKPFGPDNFYFSHKQQRKPKHFR